VLSCIRFVALTDLHPHRPRRRQLERIAGHVPVKKLGPGTYRLRSVLKDVAGVAHTFDTLFWVIPVPRFPRVGP
jgi:hypothetical protein